MKRVNGGALIAAAAAGLMALSASAALAVSPQSPYTNVNGVTNGLTGAAPRIAGMDLNPGHIGQWLWGPYYDVRPVTNGGTGAADPQALNIQILNTNPNDPSSDDYNPFGGIIARVRFHESKTSREVLDFDVVLSCGEVWTGRLDLPGGVAGKPRIFSEDPISPCDDARNTSTQFVTEPTLNGNGLEFPSIPTGLSVADIQRGYFTVTAMESLPCEPIGGLVTRAGNTWNRICPDGDCAAATPTNALAAEAILIRVAAGVSHFYNLEAVTRFVQEDFGSVYRACSLGLPDVDDCRGLDNNGELLTTVECVDQMNFILSKSRLTPQYDIQDIDGGSTRVVFTLPTKRFKCNLNGSQTDYNNVPNPPFSCQGAGGNQGGEQIGCVAYNRIEDFETEGGCPVSPCPPRSLCALPREMSIFNVFASDSATSAAYVDVSDRELDVTGIPREHQAGWLDFNLYRDPTSASQLHEQFGLDAQEINLLGVGYSRYRGLPVLSLVLQEYLNAGLNPVGVYGGTLPPPYEVYIALGS